MDGIGSVSDTPVPKFCESCGKGFPWADKIGGDPVTKLEPVFSVERFCKRIALVIRQLRARHSNRDAHDVQAEYDVQDLLYALLHLFFDDVRAEEYTSSYAGKSIGESRDAAGRAAGSHPPGWFVPALRRE
jgi:REase_DpnII-MboI